MKRYIVFLFIIISLGVALAARAGTPVEFNPVISTAWLHKNIGDPSIIVLDIRKVEDYIEDHIPGSISLTFNAWRTMEDNLGCQLPQKDELADTVCSIGAGKNTHIIIVGKTDTDIDRVNATRVAWTLKYAGIQKLSILEGGYNKWVNENKPVTEKVTKRAQSKSECAWKDHVLATRKDVVASCAGKAAVTIIDTRPAIQFAGRTACPTVKRKGHIPGAVNLPYSLVFTKDGMFENKERLRALASQHVGENKDREIIVVCSNGQFASAWWFALSEILEYKNVRIYDGSMEDWCCDLTSPLSGGPAGQ
jgi:thiosulfate/3-mercaptopyruvate sulfurtransferase